MDNLEILKMELLSQKVEIENKGGLVSVANDNPSPAEITEGIKTIAIPDLTIATALEDDVVLGKTFYAGDNTIKTGSKQIADLSNATATPEDVMSGKTFYAGNQEIQVGTYMDNSQMYSRLFISADSTGDEQFYFTVPAGIKKLKPYLLYENPNIRVEVMFNNELEEIGDYAFSSCKKATFPNFASLQNLKKVGQFSFYSLTQCPIDLSSLPTSITSLGLRSFNNSVAPNTNIVVHQAIQTMGSYSFANSGKTEMNNLNIANNIALKALPSYMIENLIFNCDFTVPATVTTLSSSFAYGASFNNITIPATCKTISNAAFYMKKTDSVSYRRLQTVTFESETPPSFGSNVFADQDIANGFKIYVPDNAVDTYKAVAKLANYVAHIYPVSQKS